MPFKYYDDQNGGGGGGGGGSVQPDASAVFIDYNGSIVSSYTLEEVNSLTALPDNPDHSSDAVPLVSQGWNWTLEEIKAQLAAIPSQVVCVGQQYITADAKTHIKIYIDPVMHEDRMSMTVRFAQSVARGVTVDWGDGTPVETYAGTAHANHDHVYAAPGWYDITLDVTQGTVRVLGSVGTGAKNICGQLTGSTAVHRERIREIRIGANVHTEFFGDAAIHQCYDLQTITIPSGLTMLGNYSFQNCRRLVSITLPRGMTNIGTYAFDGCRNMSSVSLPGTITTIGNFAFHDIYAEYLTLSNNVRTLGNNVFEECIRLKSVAVPSSVTSYGTNLFYECSGLRNATICNGITTLRDNMFTYDYNLETVSIPSSVTVIEPSVFSDCTRLKSADLPNGLTSIGQAAFRNDFLLENVSIPDTVTSIGERAFAFCTNLKSAVVPNGVTILEYGVFDQCYDMNSVSIPESVTILRQNVFGNNACLTSVRLPSSLKQIGGSAFYNCYSMKEYHMTATTPPTLDSTNAFTGIASDCVIYVPYSSDHSVLEAYKNATNWSVYAGYMQEEQQ